MSPTVITTLSILAAMVVAFLVRRRVLRRVWGIDPKIPTLDWRQRVELHFQDLSTPVWIFARLKLRLDAMFRELPPLLTEVPNMHSALDVGCGFGVAACALLEWYPALKLYGVDPNPKRVAGAAQAVGQRGEIRVGRAPDLELPWISRPVDAVFVLDVIHYLDDAALDLTLRRIRAKLDDGGYLFVRASMPPRGIGSAWFNLYRIARNLGGIAVYFRPVERIEQALAAAGFRVTRSEISGGSPELHWFVAVAQPGYGSTVAVVHNQENQQQNDGGVGENHLEHPVMNELVPPL